MTPTALTQQCARTVSCMLFHTATVKNTSRDCRWPFLTARLKKVEGNIPAKTPGWRDRLLKVGTLADHDYTLLNIMCKEEASGYVRPAEDWYFTRLDLSLTSAKCVRSASSLQSSLDPRSASAGTRIKMNRWNKKQDSTQQEK